MPPHEKNILINYFETFNTYSKSVLDNNCFILVYNFRLTYFVASIIIQNVAPELLLCVFMWSSRHFSSILIQVGILWQRLVEVSELKKKLSSGLGTNTRLQT